MKINWNFSFPNIFYQCKRHRSHGKHRFGWWKNLEVENFLNTYIHLKKNFPLILSTEEKLHILQRNANKEAGYIPQTTIGRRPPPPSPPAPYTTSQTTNHAIRMVVVHGSPHPGLTRAAGAWSLSSLVLSCWSCCTFSHSFYGYWSS